MTFSVKRSLVAGLVLALCPLAPAAQRVSQHSAARKPCRATRYYIIAKAVLATPVAISVFGASNLPPGAVLNVNIYDYIGKGSKILNNATTVSVGNDGLFEATILPKRGLEFRTNLVCDTVFGPSGTAQPAHVFDVVGRIGQHLFTASGNPQIPTASGNPEIQKDSGGRGAMLYNITVVTP